MEVFVLTLKLAHDNLNTSDIISFILEILSDSRYEFAQSTYLSALSVPVLSIPKYQNNITEQQWKELMKLCQNFYDSESRHIKKDIILEALYLIIKYGCSLSSLTLTLKTKQLTPFLGKYFDTK